jgi:hypothetical protein
MSRSWKSVFVLSALVFVSVGSGFASGVGDQSVWRHLEPSQVPADGIDAPARPATYQVFSLDKAALRQALRRAPEEFTNASGAVLALPMPDGTTARFEVWHSLIVEPGLLVHFPELGATYSGQGIDDPTATVRFDLLPSGFHSMILSPSGTVMVDPIAPGDTVNYISYYKRDWVRTGDFKCQVGNGDSFEQVITPTEPNKGFLPPMEAPQVISGTQLRTYRLALAATQEYTNAVGGGTVAGALAAQVLVMNRVNGVYQRDLAVRMVIVAANNLIIYTAEPDPYSNNDPSALLTQNQSNLDSVIGSVGYDIGHVFSTGGGGVAVLGGPCQASIKAQGETGLPNPVGDPFAIDFVSHEMGHQFGARHTFNSTTDSCGGGNRQSVAAYEPGSGITIMGYAGTCGSQNLALHSIDTFHVKSLEEMVAYTTGGGDGCAVHTPTGNTPPNVTGPGNFNVPKRTPFLLTATGTDPNGDSLTYDWQEYDLGPESNAIPNSDQDGFARPIFRPFPAMTTGTRTFPRLTNILNNANVPPNTTGGYLTGEILPSITRTMAFQVVVRDNRANGGGINTATATLSIDGNSGPFNVTSPNTNVTYPGNSAQTVTWSVANTNAAPINAASVKISMSTDGGNNFPLVLNASTANDGSEIVTIPNVPTTTARIKVEAVGNIFFDISDANFTVTGSALQARTDFDYDHDGRSDISVFRASTGAWYLQRSTQGLYGTEFGLASDKICPGDFDGDGKTDIAVYRPSTGIWYVTNSTNGAVVYYNFGIAEDLPVPADYDGDGRADVAVFRPSNGTWYRQNSSNGQFVARQFGATGDKPAVGNYDGDNKADLCVFRPSTAAWYRINSSDGAQVGEQFGISTDLISPADFDGDGRTDLAVFRPATAYWFIKNSSNSSVTAFPFGLTTDIPAAADFDGDGHADLCVFRPANGTWYRMNSSNGQFVAMQFGVNGDKPTQTAFRY